MTAPAQATVSGQLSHAAEECEQVAKAIEAVGDAARRLLSSRLELGTLCVLIRESLPRGSKSITEAQIRAVLQAAAAMPAIHLKAGK